MKKIFYAILNFFKLLFLTLISPFVKEKKETKVEVKETIKSDKLEQLKKEQLNYTGAVTGIPDGNNIINNPHDNNTSEGETESTRIYSLPLELGKILNPNEKYTYLAFSDEEIDELIDKELEEVYKEDNFKVYKANNITKKKIEKFKKEIVPKIKDKIYYNNITNEKKLKKEIEELVAEQLMLTPIFENKEEKEKDPYFLAMPHKKGLNLNDEEPVKTNTEPITINIEEKEIIDEKLELPSLRMVKNTDEIKEPSILPELPKLAAATVAIVANEAIEIIGSKSDEKEEKKEDHEKEETSIEVSEDKVNEKPIVDAEPEEIEKEITEIIAETDKILEEVTNIEKVVEKTTEEEKQEEEPIEEKLAEVQEEQEDIQEKIEKKDIVIDMQIDKLDTKTMHVIDDAKKEAAKNDFFDKDYENEQKQIDKMLEKISDTRIKYGDKLTKDQKERLDKKEQELRSAKEKLETSKEKDIAFEKTELEATIKEQEITGLQREIETMHLEYQKEANDNLIKKLDKLEGVTKEQVASTDRKIMMHRFNKASFLLEMSSLLAFPFVRNKYFRLFTVGLVVDNHLGFAHAFLNRKANRYQPVDLERIKKGQDALDGAIDLAYKDLVQLDYIEQQAYTRYPELQFDTAYQASVSRVRNNLTNQFNKLQKKQETMEKYYTKGKRQKKVLKKIEG